ncbi:MAG: glycosyltransferase family 4 protein [Fervidobacterium sp.]|uniref:glycosyltransferase family 4 protein n=1 Tax=Fervidobacterium sp. TaxID=1871331 RepID=UPI00404A896B
MRVLVLTNFYPVAGNEIGGVFVRKRLEMYSAYDVSYNAVSLVYSESKGVKLLRKLLNEDVQISPPLTLVRGIKYFPVFGTVKVFDALRLKFWKSSRVVKKLSGKLAREVVKRVARTERYDIVHAHGMYYPFPAGLVARRISQILRIPYVVTLHGTDVNRWMRNEELRRVYIDVLENASRCIFVSRMLLEIAERFGYSGKNSIVIPNGFDPEIFKPMDKLEVRRELGIYKQGYNYVGFVGNLLSVKRADKLGELFHKIKEKVPNVFFIVVGDGELRKKLESETENLEVLFAGRVSQEKVGEYMNAMDVMVLPSRQEGFGAVVIEAQACGTCVIGSSNGGIPEAIGFDEYVVQEGEDFEERFAMKVVDVLENGYDARRLIERAQRFTWNEIVKREISVYSEILQQKSERR